MSKNKKKNNNTFSILDDIKNDITSSQSANSGYIPDIIEFVESGKYIKKIQLFPLQRIVLKCFYIGTIGNENLKLTKDEIKFIEENELNLPENGSLLDKVNGKTEDFRELILVWGRRSGKDFLVSLIALYEALKLLESPGGNPYDLYDLDGSVPITILTIANASEQAGILFDQIKNKLVNSPYFSDKFISDGITQNSFYLLTPYDKEENKKFIEKKLPPKRGSVLIKTGHSESTSLVGLDLYIVLFDEIGLYKETGGSSSGEALWSNLTPALSTFVREKKIIKEDGEIEYKKVYDGKAICISSPRGKDGIFYKLYENSLNNTKRLMCRAPTWVVNSKHTRESLLAEYAEASIEKFNMEYGAEFSGSASNTFFHPDVIEKVFAPSPYRLTDAGKPGFKYFMHLDPATSSHNYALVICHKEFYFDKTRGNEKNFFVVVDHIKYWSPSEFSDGVINTAVVEDYVINITKRFNVRLVTFDQWNSRDSIKRIKSKGISCKMTRFTSRYKNIIYDNLEDLVNSNRLIIPRHELMRAEMINLQRRYTATGYKVFPKKGADVDTDDLVDSLAGACFMCIDEIISGLPRSRFANSPTFSSENNILWRSMQGTPYGYGTGEQVSKYLERRASWPKR